MEIRKAKEEDLSEILSIYEYARVFMAEHGNPNQWKSIYPEQEIIENDINNEDLYLCTEENKITCVFFYKIFDDPTYRKINGNWLNSDKYAVVHRIASAKSTKGAATYALNWAYGQYPNLKIDTHEDNIPMQNLLKKLGFEFCGIIHIENGEERWAYQKTNI